MDRAQSVLQKLLLLVMVCHACPVLLGPMNHPPNSAVNVDGCSSLVSDLWCLCVHAYARACVWCVRAYVRACMHVCVCAHTSLCMYEHSIDVMMIILIGTNIHHSSFINHVWAWH